LEVLQYATSGNDFDVIIEPETVPDDGRYEFISNIIRELLSIGPTRRPRADVLYKRFISWGSDISVSQPDSTITLVQTTTNAFDMTIPSTSVLELPTPYAGRPNPSLSHNAFPSHADSSIRIVDHSASPVEHTVLTIIAQGSEHSHLAADNSPVASWCGHRAQKSANRAEIERYNKQLLRAAITGNIEAVKFLVEEAGADVEVKDSIQRTPLTCAAMNGHLEVIKFLVQEGGADVESKDLSQRTPLSHAAYWSHLEAVKLLVEEGGADVASKDEDGQSALELARQGIREGWWGGGSRRAQGRGRAA